MVGWGGWGDEGVGGWGGRRGGEGGEGMPRSPSWFETNLEVWRQLYVSFYPQTVILKWIGIG